MYLETFLTYYTQVKKKLIIYLLPLTVGLRTFYVTLMELFICLKRFLLECIFVKPECQYVRHAARVFLLLLLFRYRHVDK